MGVARQRLSPGHVSHQIGLPTLNFELLHQAVKLLVRFEWMCLMICLAVLDRPDGVGPYWYNNWDPHELLLITIIVNRFYEYHFSSVSKSLRAWLRHLFVSDMSSSATHPQFPYPSLAGTMNRT